MGAPNEEPLVFPSRCWLAEDEGDGLAVRVLKPGETIQPTYDSKFKSSNLRKAREKQDIIYCEFKRGKMCNFLENERRDFTFRRRGKGCTGHKEIKSVKSVGKRRCTYKACPSTNAEN